METRHRIERQAARILGAQEVPGRGTHQRLFQPVEYFRIRPPMRPVEQLQRDRSSAPIKEFSALSSSASQSAKPGAGDSVTKVESLGSSRGSPRPPA